VDNDSLICDCVKVPLSSVDNRLEKVGYEGSALLQDMMEGKRQSRELVLVPPAPEVVARKSSDMLAVKHPALKRAVEFIRKNYDDGDISVKKISHAAFISESGLRMLFKEHLDASPLHLVHRLRIQKACDLLRETNMKIDSIAKQSGFNASRRFYDIFRKEMKVSPHEFRKEHQ
jgi:LacI family transcriptional regulator